MRNDGRTLEEIRPVTITRNFTKHAGGSVLMEMGDTKVLCTAMVEEKVPPFLKGSGKGWVTAEYAMLPSATQSRKQRDISKLRLDGRSTEIQRLIGRALRSVMDLTALGERTVWIDCDVIQADGGTRCASITGAYVALVDALHKIHEETPFEVFPVRGMVSAVSVGIHELGPLVDLNYLEDSSALVDMNIVMNGQGEFIELQGTGEERPFSAKEMQELLSLGTLGNEALVSKVQEALGEDVRSVLG
ncbi:MAG TPA: ribonuclease PH [Clostridiaceae bacterium]|nr:ribonuclease PH [Clostridiaceae bacterium]